MAGRYEIFRGTNQQYYFRLKASNGEIILASEGYQTKQGAENGVASVKRHSPFEKYYERRTARNDQLYFVLKAENGQVIGVSETYVSNYGRDNGIRSVMTNGPSAAVSDLT